MQNQNQTQNGMQMPQNMMDQTATHNHGAHELFDAHEVIGCLIGAIEQYQLYDQNIQCQELKGILQRQTSFMLQMYNTIVDTFQSGQDPQVPTQQYKMQQSNEVTYGVKAGQPKQPKMAVNQLTDECYSSFMLGQIKAASSGFTTAAAEMNHPVLRRILADSIPNLIEMSYELFLYQNKNGYYQIPQLKEQDMNIMVQAYAKAPQQNMH
ncbi:spore coat protein [Gracilibacillus caseinilyticus]|uniref:Spore coat protein n=1 Tax=Gracilibacillus caseinilyticus TaxID=2932256 RepID=A0ABY4EW22_9BACI|nr:spore coat protein [Gracilibacillus caseinilyticus]UOQ48594.1 spore coat protein [Gracilibacillus caseinilyticus]